METAAGSESTRTIGGSYTERRTVFAKRMMDCMSKAFHAVGTGPLMEDYIYWRLSLRLDDVVERPQRFIESLKAVFGEAGASLYEHRLVEEVRREFGVLQATGKEELTTSARLGERLQAAVTAAWTAS